MNKRIILSSAISMAFLTGCATVTRGVNDTITVNSDPANANVVVSSGQRSKTPATFKLPRNKAVTVDVSKDGYESQSIQVVPQIQGGGAAGMAGNVLVGGIIGVGVDAVSGAMYDLKPDQISVKLHKINM